jgi:hypothetical protein
MKSSVLGKKISPVEINITRFGLWLCLSDEEFFLTYEDYPFFKNAKIPDIYDVELHHGTHLHWPTLDVDLNVAILKIPITSL